MGWQASSVAPSPRGGGAAGRGGGAGRRTAEARRPEEASFSSAAVGFSGEMGDMPRPPALSTVSLASKDSSS